MLENIYSQFIIPGLWEIGIFIAIFAESLPFIGALVPGGVIVLFLAGLFSKTGHLNIFVSLAVCFLASFTIDLYGYHIGKKKGEEWIHKYSKLILIKKDFLHKIADLLKKHPTRLLIVGKFNPATRSMTPFMAGMKGVDYSKFRKITLLNSLIWVTIFFGLGYLIGTGMGYVEFLGKFAIIFSLGLFFAAYILYLVKEKKAKLAN
jgi:membrane-associated protein